MSEHNNDDDRYYLTLHVDLLNTALEDFIAHVEDGFIVRRLAHLGLKDKTAGQWQEVKDWPLTPVDRITKENIWNLSADSGQTLIGTTFTQKGNLSCLWFVYYPTQGGQRWSVIERPESGKSDFRLEATHYRRDRLNVVMWESPNIEPILGDILLAWMKQYWSDDGVDDLMKRGVQSPAPPNGDDLQKRWQPRSRADKWLVQQYFDVCQEQRPLTYFRKEWLRLRREDVLPDPADVDNSMAQVISKERKARGGE